MKNIRIAGQLLVIMKDFGKPVNNLYHSAGQTFLHYLRNKCNESEIYAISLRGINNVVSYFRKYNPEWIENDVVYDRDFAKIDDFFTISSFYYSINFISIDFVSIITAPHIILLSKIGKIALFSNHEPNNERRYS